MIVSLRTRSGRYVRAWLMIRVLEQRLHGEFDSVSEIVVESVKTCSLQPNLFQHDVHH